MDRERPSGRRADESSVDNTEESAGGFALSSVFAVAVAVKRPPRRRAGAGPGAAERSPPVPPAVWRVGRAKRESRRRGRRRFGGGAGVGGEGGAEITLRPKGATTAAPRWVGVAARDYSSRAGRDGGRLPFPRAAWMMTIQLAYEGGTSRPTERGGGRGPKGGSFFPAARAYARANASERVQHAGKTPPRPPTITRRQFGSMIAVRPPETPCMRLEERGRIGPGVHAIPGPVPFAASLGGRGGLPMADFSREFCPGQDIGPWGWLVGLLGQVLARLLEHVGLFFGACVRAWLESLDGLLAGVVRAVVAF